MVAPNSAPSSRAVAEVNDPTVSPVCAAPRPAWLEKNCPMHEAEVGATAPAGAAVSRPTNNATVSATTTRNHRACTAITLFWYEVLCKSRTELIYSFSQAGQWFTRRTGPTLLRTRGVLWSSYCCIGHQTFRTIACNGSGSPGRPGPSAPSFARGVVAAFGACAC